MTDELVGSLSLKMTSSVTKLKTGAKLRLKNQNSCFLEARLRYAPLASLRLSAEAIFSENEATNELVPLLAEINPF
jgi:hypothetical protein